METWLTLVDLDLKEKRVNGAALPAIVGSCSDAVVYIVRTEGVGALKVYGMWLLETHCVRVSGCWCVVDG